MISMHNGFRVVFSWLYHTFADFTRPKKQRRNYFYAWLKMNYRWIDRYPNIPSIQFNELFPDADKHVIKMEVAKKIWNIMPQELYIMSCIVQELQPEKIFEFGTYDGATTMQLASCSPHAEVVTIDFSPKPTPDFYAGERFHGSEQEDRIKQIFGDSTKYNFSDHYGQYDFIFIDGGHEYDVAYSDTQNALRMVKKGGVIVWDDYINWRGVKRVVEDLSKNYEIHHIIDTKFAILIKK